MFLRKAQKLNNKMQLHELKPIHKGKSAKRVGRGGAHGFTSGRGQKGQTSRSGKKFKPVIRELIKRYAKLRGYKFKSQALKPRVINLEILNKNFQSGEKVSPQTLAEKRVVRKINGMIPLVKILGSGEIKSALVFENCLFSQSAKKKIEKAGGEIITK